MPKIPGSGRKPNTPNKFMAERAERAEAEGKPLPPENMLTIAGNAMAMAAKYQPRLMKDGELVTNPLHDEDRYHHWLKLGLDANNKAAPYYCPRMSAIHVTYGEIDPNMLTDEEIAIVQGIYNRQQTGEGIPDQGRPGSSVRGNGTTRH